MKLVVIGVMICIAFFTKGYIGKFGTAIGYLIGLFFGGLMLIGFKYAEPVFNLIDEKRKTLKSRPYTEKYGKGFQHPAPSDFEITNDEFKSYNDRMQFSFLQIIFTYGLFITTLVYTIQLQEHNFLKLVIMGSSVIVAISFHHFFNYLNKRLSQRHPSYKKIRRFQETLDIYYRIRNENKET